MVPGLNSDADDFVIFGGIESNRDLRLDIPSLTSDYYLVSYTDALTNSDWGLTSLVLGVDGVLIWRDADVVSRSAIRYYRVFSRLTSEPADSDNDGIDDVYELNHPLLLDPLNPNDAAEDADGDGLTNQQEYAHGTDLELTDTDGDGLDDYEEVMTHGTNPLSSDTDADGMSDEWEVSNSLDPLVDDTTGDPDGDGLDNQAEMAASTNPQLSDTDSDGLPDGWEVDHAFDPISDGGLSYGLAARWAFDEGVGGIVSNSLSTQWPGALRFMVESNWTSGRGGHALWFDGVNDHILISQAGGAVVTGTPFTVTAVVWQDADGTSTYPTVVSDVQLLSSNRWPGFTLRYQRPQNTLMGQAGNFTTTAYGVIATNWSPKNEGRWVDVALSHDGTQVCLFVEGREVSCKNQAFDASLQPELKIAGGHINVTDAYWRGKIDDLRIFHSALDSNDLVAVNEWLGDADDDGLSNGQEYDLGTHPRDTDTDGDGLGDYDEVMSYGTDPLSTDTDADGMSDAWELANGLDPLVDDADVDSDGDGLINLQELGYGTNPQNADSDGDDLNDYAEIVTHATNPLSADTDSDGMPDGWEVSNTLNPLVDDASADPDGDGLTNLQEQSAGTDPALADTDADGMPDGWEVSNGLNPLLDDAAADADGEGLLNFQEYSNGTDPQVADTDGDSLNDYAEVVTHGTDPLADDSDTDGMLDGWEVSNGLNPLLDDASADPDSDDLTNLQEQSLGTLPQDSDSDADGMLDGWEVLNGLNPLLDDAADDPDGDGLTNLQEQGVGTNPQESDTDLDGMPDGWEVAVSLDPLTDDAAIDADSDSLTNLQEYGLGTHPQWLDSDTDGMPDGWEVDNSLDPLTYDADDDADGDGLRNLQEYGVGTNPQDNDSDTDGMLDGWEITHSLDPLTDDAAGDADADGLTNLEEQGYGTDPQVTDTDGDSLSDKAEVSVHSSNPLNPDTDSDGLPDGWEVDNSFSPVSDGGLAYGLVARWAFDEGSGTVSTNEVSTNWPATLRQMQESSWTTGRGGKALWFDGTNDFVSVAQTAGAVVTAAPYTVTAVLWQDFTVTSYFPTVISDVQLLSGGRWPGFVLRYQESVNRLIGMSGNTNTAASGVLAANWSPDYTGRWVDVALSHDGTRVRLFVGGQEVSSAAQAFDAYEQAELRIGGGHINVPDAYWCGGIDDIRIFHAALDTNELSAVNEWVGDADGDGLSNGREYELGTFPRDTDTDGDGLSDYDEVMTYGTNPLSSDTDGDGLPDDWELNHALDPLVNDSAADSDGDGLSNLQEYGVGTDPQQADTDGDGLNDYAEVITHATNPLLSDTDGDGLPDGWEVSNGLNPLVDDAAADPDGDGLTNLQEYNYDTDPKAADTDGDGMPDGWEVNNSLDPLVDDAADDADSEGLTNLAEYTNGTDPQAADTDGDGLSDYDEVITYVSNPLSTDTDGDGMPDGWEVAVSLNLLVVDASGDPDADGLTNLQEYGLGTHPQWLDTDGDGMPDGWEVDNSLDPLSYDADDDLDSDGLRNIQEYGVGTNPQDVDTDSDGMLDGWEVSNGLNPLVDDAAADPDGDGLTNLQEQGYDTDPQLMDTDGDGLGDGDEIGLYLSNPLNPDTDSDGLPDGWELANSFNLVSDGGLAYGLEVRWKFDEGAGTTVSNEVSSQWPGTLRSMSESSWTTGRGGSALWFDGTNDLVAVDQTGGAVVTAAPYTVTAVLWQDFTVTSYFPTVISDVQLLSGGRWPGFVLRYQESVNGLIGMSGNTNTAASGVLAANWSPDYTGRWVDVALSHDGTRVRLFVGGQEVSSAAQAFDAYEQAELRIGGGHINVPDAYWCGGIDDIRIFHAALDTNELSAVNEWVGDADGDGLSNGREYELGTSPRETDTDGDGLSDYDEVMTYGTNPLSSDTDGDGLPDAWELNHALDPLVNDATGDPDGDGLSNLQEYGVGTDPQQADTDGDGLNDYAEVITHVTDPLNSDTDGDSMPDGWEVSNGLDPLVDDASGDPDSDGLTNLQEYGYATDPKVLDTDGDGMPDGWEVTNGFNPLVDDASDDADGDGLTNLQEYTYNTDPRVADTDGDGLDDYAEVMTHDTDPLSIDTDGDGLPDGWEVANGLYPKSAIGDDGASGDPDGDGLTNLEEFEADTDPQVADTDEDGLNDAEELSTYSTDPLNSDTDSDGLPDGWEVDNTFNPLSDGGSSYGLAARWAFDEGVGEVASNQVSTNWPGTLRFMVESNWISGRGGQALWFDGTNDYVAVNQTAGAVITGAPFTVTAVIWQETDGTSAYPTVLSDVQLLSSNRWPGYAMRYQYSQNRFVGFAGNSNAAANWVSQTDWSPEKVGGWVDVALAHDGTQARLFVDGKEVSSALHPFDACLQPELRIGRGHVNVPDSYWRGAIDDLRLFHTALDTNELAAVNEWVGDADGDGLTNGREYELGTDPRDVDTDGDGLSDYVEVLTYGTDPLLSDTDSDGLPDAWELENSLDPLVDDATADPDGDSLTNLQEYGYDTNPQDADPDGDGLNDYAEVITYATNPFAADSDGDGLDDYAEVITYGTNPWSSDSDSDGLPDIWEVEVGLDPLVGTGDDGPDGDPDGDNLTNLEEYQLGTHPLMADTDSDGLDDDDELTRGTDPLDEDSDADGLPDGWEVQYAFTPLSGMDANLDLRCWLQFDEGTGTSLVNSAQTEFQAEVRVPSATQWSNGISGGALWFDGTDGYAAILQPSNSVVTGSSFTVCAWIWGETNSASLYPTIFSDSRWTGGTNWPGYMLRVSDAQNQLSGMVGTSTQPSTDVSAGWWTERWTERWTHIALVQDDGLTQLYVDGSLWGEETNTFGMATNSEIRIGRGHINVPDSGWRGKIDEVRIYGTALTPEELGELYDAQGDADSDGTNNLTAWQDGLDPRAGAGTVSTEGSLDIQFVPDTDWTTNESPQYLAKSGNSNPGGELHLFVENDALNFLLIDADGQRHSIQRRNLVGGGHLMSNATNRITASWRGFNTGQKTVDMRLFINGLDYQQTTEFINNPRLTSYDWEQGGSYWNASFIQADWNTTVRSNSTRFGSWADGVFPLKATLIETHVHSTAYGIVSSNPTPPFTLEVKTPPDPGDRPRTLIQSLPRPKVLADFVSSNEMRVLIRRYQQITDVAESDMNWLGWDDPETVWDIMEDNVRTAIEIGNEEGLDIAISSWIFLDAKICRKYPSMIEERAKELMVVTNGTEVCILLTNSAWYTSGGTFLEEKFDIADPSTVSNYLDAWEMDLSQFSDYAYFFFNEDALQPLADPTYLNGPTYSTNGLAWFRDYTVTKYGTGYSQIRFPISPLALGIVGVTNESRYQVVLDDSVTNRVVLTTDPDHWAKWWEWRQVVFANLMDGYTRRLADLNSTNTHWRGSIHFIAPGSAWELKAGINLDLLSKIPNLDWMVVENNRAGSYGTSDALQEEEVQLQFEGMKAVTSTNTGFGSYVMAHTYPYPEVTNGVTNATFNTTWMTQDFAYASSSESQSSLVVGYSALMLVNRPGFTSTWQNATYIPEVAEAWCTARFGQLWTPLEGHSVSEGSWTYPPYDFLWDPLEQAKAYDWEFSSTSNFSSTNLSAQTTNTYHTWSMMTDSMPCAEPLYWRVRGVFHVLAYDEDGVITGTNVYQGAWAPSTNSITLEDTDSDDLPDIWEYQWFGDLDEVATGDPDGDYISNLTEYLNSTNPAP